MSAADRIRAYQRAWARAHRGQPARPRPPKAETLEADQTDLEAERERLTRYQAAQRRCLSCDARFASDHAGNRMCGPCKLRYRNVTWRVR